MVNVYVKLNSIDEEGSSFPHLITVDDRSDFDIVMNFLNTVNVHPTCDAIQYHVHVHGSHISQEEWKLLEESAELLDVEFIIEESADESESL